MYIGIFLSTHIAIVLANFFWQIRLVA